MITNTPILPNIPTLPSLGPLLPAPAIVPTGEGELLQFFGEQVRVKITGEQTGGAYALMDFVTPPGAGAPPHSHDCEDEVFMIQSGGLRILADGEWHEVGPGDVVFAPKGQVHAFQNHLQKPCRFWLLVSPAGFEDFYRELSADSAGKDAPDADRIRVICERHGIRLAD